jgi:23S rRNA pseudouridine1911/1915/1917 synthase
MAKVRYKMFPAQPEVLWENNHLLAIVKPFGMLSQKDESDEDSAREWAEAYIRTKYNKKSNIFVHPTHRLDRNVGGILLFARTDKAASRLGIQFKDRLVHKTYIALVEGVPEQLEDVLVHYISPGTEKNRVNTSDKNRHKDAKQAILYYRVLYVVGKRAMLEVHPLTGRKHQIRAQLAKIGHPILGDVKYGGRYLQTESGNIALFSRELAFKHPTQDQLIRLTAPLPMHEDWGHFIRNLY